MCEKTEKQHELDKRYLRMAAIWAENSYCKRRQVGALLVKDKMIISDGYNGTPAGFENVCLMILDTMTLEELIREIKTDTIDMEAIRKEVELKQPIVK